MGQITVIIPCYNYGPYLAEAIESVLSQTRKPLEIIVMDDASTDNTAEVASRYPVTYVKNPINLGTVANLNKGVSLAKGDYVISLDADNRLRPDYLQKTGLILDTQPDVAIVYTHMALFGPQAEPVYSSQPAWQAGQEGGFYLWKVPEFNPLRLKLGNYIHGSALFRAEAWEKAGGYPEVMRAEDWQLWKNIIRLGWTAKLVPEYLLEYRQHGEIQRNIIGQSQAISQFKVWVKTALLRLGLYR